MNIKEIFERERLYTASHIDNYEHNKSIDRVEAAGMTYIKWLEKQVSTLEKAFIFEGKKYEERIRELEAECTRLREKTIIKAT